MYDWTKIIIIYFKTLWKFNTATKSVYTLTLSLSLSLSLPLKAEIRDLIFFSCGFIV